MGLIFDSSVFIEAERRNLTLETLVALAPADEAIAIAAVTVAELLVGVHLARPPERMAERDALVQRVIDRFPILDFDLDVARTYSEVWATLRRAGNIIAPHDLMIGATALANQFDVLTDNVRHFERIPGLQVRRPNW